MTEAEKIVLVKALTDEEDADTISAFLAMAGDAVYHYADPFSLKDKATTLEKYGGAQARAAAYFLNKRGADGQTGHNENGISRSYESGDLPDSIKREITPLCGVAR